MKTYSLILALCLNVSAAAEQPSPESSILVKTAAAGVVTYAPARHLREVIRTHVAAGRDPVINHIGLCSYMGTTMYVTAMYSVFTGSSKTDGKPTQSPPNCGPWLPTLNGALVSYSIYRGPKGERPAATVTRPEHGSMAAIVGALYHPIKDKVVFARIEGELQTVSEKEHIDRIRRALGNSLSSFRLRLNHSDTPFVAVRVPADALDVLRAGLGGALIWQNDHPVAIFSTAVVLEDEPKVAYLLGESLVPALDSVRAAAIGTPFIPPAPVPLGSTAK